MNIVQCRCTNRARRSRCQSSRRSTRVHGGSADTCTSVPTEPRTHRAPASDLGQVVIMTLHWPRQSPARRSCTDPQRTHRQWRRWEDLLDLLPRENFLSPSLPLVHPPFPLPPLPPPFTPRSSYPFLPHFPSSFLHVPPLRSRTPKIQLGDLGPKSYCVHYSLKYEIWWQLATSVISFLRINWPNLVQLGVLFKQYKANGDKTGCWYEKSISPFGHW